MKRFVISLLFAVVLFLGLKDTSLSIPAFARKYKTSCATCHNGFPKLNAFGEAFRRNGYQFPDHGDAEVIKEEPVSLGSDGNKKAFPDAIWPGTLPGSSPISLFFNGEMDYNPKVDPRFTFDGLGSSIEAVAAGTLGEDLSFWGHLIVNSDGTVELNRMFLIFSNLVGDSYALNARIGVIEPGLFSFSTHRAWLEGYWMTTRPFSGDMGWTIEETQKGIELNGMAAGRFGWNAGIVEGIRRSPFRQRLLRPRDVQVRRTSARRSVEGGAAPNNAKPYFDNSVTHRCVRLSGKGDARARQRAAGQCLHAWSAPTSMPSMSSSISSGGSACAMTTVPSLEIRCRNRPIPQYGLRNWI